VVKGYGMVVLTGKINRNSFKGFGKVKQPESKASRLVFWFKLMHDDDGWTASIGEILINCAR